MRNRIDYGFKHRRHVELWSVFTAHIFESRYPHILDHEMTSVFNLTI